MSDAMDTLAGLPPGSSLAELRRQRPDVVKHLQGSDDVIFSPADDGGLTRAERAAAALRVAKMLRDETIWVPAFISAITQPRIADMPDDVAMQHSAPSSAARRS